MFLAVEKEICLGFFYAKSLLTWCGAWNLVESQLTMVGGTGSIDSSDLLHFSVSRLSTTRAFIRTVQYSILNIIQFTEINLDKVHLLFQASFKLQFQACRTRPISPIPHNVSREAPSGQPQPLATASSNSESQSDTSPPNASVPRYQLETPTFLLPPLPSLLSKYRASLGAPLSLIPFAAS
jgi:hypothetical protein